MKEILFLDSASLEDAREAANLGIVAGITTNPTLIAREGVPAAVRIHELLEVFPGWVFHQPASVDPVVAGAELEDLMRGNDRLVAKLPAIPALFPLAASLSAEGSPTAITAVYSSGQALASAAAGARWIIPYVDRAARLMEGGDSLVRELASAIAGVEARPAVLAASLKSAEEAVGAILDGATSVSVPLDILGRLLEHPLTGSAVEGFAADAAKGYVRRPSGR